MTRSLHARLPVLLEDDLPLRLADARAGVAHFTYAVSTALGEAHEDLSDLRELHSVADHVAHDLTHAAFVGPDVDRPAVLEAQRQMRFRGEDRELAHHVLGDR